MAAFAVLHFIESFKPPLLKVGVRRTVPVCPTINDWRVISSLYKTPFYSLKVKTLWEYEQCSLCTYLTATTDEMQWKCLCADEGDENREDKF